jgi:hypothetical protein
MPGPTRCARGWTPDRCRFAAADQVRAGAWAALWRRAGRQKSRGESSRAAACMPMWHAFVYIQTQR